MMYLRLAIGLLLLALAPASIALPADDWRSDLAELVALIEANHPDPFTRISEAEFDRRVAALTNDIDSMSNTQIAVAMMTLVGSLRDGHTTLHPVDPVGFNHWLPLSFYWFEDGVAVVAAHEKYGSLIGSKIVSIGNTDIDTALRRVTGLISSDNDSGNRQNIFYLASVDVLEALGFAEDVDSVRLGIEDKQGRSAMVDIDSVITPFIANESRFWGEMYAPLDRAVLADFVMPFDDLNLVEYTRATPEDKKSLPLHVRHRHAYWSTFLPDEEIYYVQINHTTSEGRGEYDSFEHFYRSVFEFVENNPVDKFILDIRYNSGGDGSILYPFIHEFIRSNKANRAGHLYTIVGRKTYSAATMLLDLMIKHTNTLLVGEPAGSALNSYGDSRNFKLSNSGMSLDVSSEYWKLVHTSESPQQTPIDIPAVFSIDDYFSGSDPALEAILAIDAPYLPLDVLLADAGGDSTMKRYLAEKENYGRRTWWRPFDEPSFRKVARGLVDGGQIADGLIGFRILVDAYPDSWRAWRDFGKAYAGMEQRDEARATLRRAQEINPGDSEINDLLESL